MWERHQTSFNAETESIGGDGNADTTGMRRMLTQRHGMVTCQRHGMLTERVLVTGLYAALALSFCTGTGSCTSWG